MGRMPVPRRKSFIPMRMPSSGTMAYYPAFPPAIRLRGVGCIRVTHPCATLTAPEGADPVRLACIRPAASVHPEPGSNSSLYYCLALFFSESRVPPRYSPLASAKGPLSLAPLPRRRCFCAGLRLSKNLCFRHLFIAPSFLPKAGAKVLPFSELASAFFKYFSSFLYLTGFQ